MGPILAPRLNASDMTHRTMGVEPLVGPPREEGMAISISATSTVFDRELAVAGAVQLAVLGTVSAAVGLSPLGWVAGLVFALVTGLLLVRHDAAGRALARGRGQPGDAWRGRRSSAGSPRSWPRARAVRSWSVLVAIGAVAIALDGLDGYLARRNNTVSVLGARFDMEVDAFLILVLSVLVCRTVGPWVLAIGLMRYAFVAAMFVMPRLRATLPFSRARKVVAAMQGGCWSRPPRRSGRSRSPSGSPRWRWSRWRGRSAVTSGGCSLTERSSRSERPH
jgi:phosphatidylglycerophosphate synthase